MNHRITTGSFVGEYRIDGFIGAGGMGEVYQATHAKLGRTAAVKVLTPGAAGADFTTRFFNEAQLQARLHHPHIATVYDFLERDGQACLVMEYVAGESLADLIAAGRLAPEHVTSIFRQIVEAVGYIHRHGIVHRDIKAGNVKLDHEGKVKLLDFGIAKLGGTPGMTRAGNVIGTLEYLAPEQLRGEEADRRSDVWALGVLLYEMLTARLPFESANVGELLSKIERTDYVPPAVLNPATPAQLAAVVTRCLRRDPAARYQTADELLDSLDALDARDAVNRRDPHTSDTTRPQSDGRRSRRLLVMGGAAGAAVVVLGMIVAAAALLLPAPDAPSTPPSDKNVAVVGRDAGGGQGAAKPIRIDVAEGRADVYRDGLRLGVTPYELPARNGEQIKLELKRDGFADKRVNFSVTENKKTYTFSMER